MVDENDLKNLDFKEKERLLKEMLRKKEDELKELEQLVKKVQKEEEEELKKKEEDDKTNTNLVHLLKESEENTNLAENLSNEEESSDVRRFYQNSIKEITDVYSEIKELYERNKNEWNEKDKGTLYDLRNKIEKIKDYKLTSEEIQNILLSSERILNEIIKYKL